MEQIQGLLDTIYRAENGGKIDYDVVYNGIPANLRPTKPITQMTVGEVMAWQKKVDPYANSEAVGAVQIIRETLADVVRAGVVSPNDMFNGETQDRITVNLMRKRGLDKWQSGAMSTTEFGTSLAKEWASLPVLADTYRNGQAVARGQAYYGGVGSNRSRAAVSTAQFEAVLGAPGRRVLALNAYAPTGRKGTMIDRGGVQFPPDQAARTDKQFRFPTSDPAQDRDPWATPDVDLVGAMPGRMTGEGAEQAFDPVQDGRDLVPADYNTRTGQGGGPAIVGWGRAFADEFTDSFIVREAQRVRLSDQYQWDRKFDPVAQAQADGYGQFVSQLGRARNKAHYGQLVKNIDAEGRRNYRREVWDGALAQTLGGILNPDSLITMGIPIARLGSAAMRGVGASARSVAVRTALYTGAGETAMEAGRSNLDPYSTELDSVMRVGGATVLSGFIGGGIGAMAGAKFRRGLANELAREVEMMRGTGKVTTEVDLGGGVKAKVIIDQQGKPVVTEGAAPRTNWFKDKNGVRVVGETVVVNPSVIAKRFRDGSHNTPALTPNELMEYEIAKAGSLSRRLKTFLKDESGALDPKMGRGEKPFVIRDAEGNAQPNMDAISEARAKSGTITLGPEGGPNAKGRIKGVRVRADIFASDEAAADAVMRANEAAGQARDSGEFRNMVSGILDGRSFDEVEALADRAIRNRAERQAETDAEKALERYRAENNRILQDWKMETLARLTDGPYKRIHRNSLAPEIRDLVDTLAADGGFLRGSDATGETLGPSVYSRARTWDGVVRGLWDKETELFEKYLGFKENPNVADIAFNKSLRRKRVDGTQAITVDEFRRRTTQSYITGEADDIPEVMEMVENLRAGFQRFEAVAEEYGVISSAKNIQARMDHLRERMMRSNKFAADELQVKIDKLADELRFATREPGEDYFTRVWNNKTIRDNRAAFKRRIVMPWMMQQPYGDVWVLGKDDLGSDLDTLKASGAGEARIKAAQKRYDKAPERSTWQRKEFSTKPEDVSKRADDMIETILAEGEPEDLATMREVNRPTFGRHRQFNIPNELLLKAGGKGNAVADFIETDPLLVMKIYTERMGPAIEMARSFGRPMDGMDATHGFADQLDYARMKEKIRWEKGGKKVGGSWEDHWSPMERDMLHLKDRVTNRVIRDPNRWDNRTATALRNWSHLAFMGASALPAITEIGTLVMRHGMGRTFQNAFGQLDAATTFARQMGVEEMRKAGAIMEVVNGAALSRFAETGMDAVTGTAPERWLKTAANKYFLWNGLAPLSTRLKELDAGLRVNDMLERINTVGMLGKGADEADLAELARWGISKADAARMAKEPMEQIEGGHWVANTDQWGDERLVTTFRAAIAQGNENTIMMATAADKPTIIDGTFYLRRGGAVDKYAKRAGLRQVGDYWQVQSGLMTLPFTFWNYALAAHNKILVAGLDEPSAQKLGGIAAMVGLGYMIASVKTPDWRWNDMDADQKILEAIDQSGIMGILSQAKGIWDQPERAIGAGPNVAVNALQGAANGDVNQMSWALPLRNHLLLRGLFDAAVDGIERSGDGGIDAAA